MGWERGIVGIAGQTTQVSLLDEFLQLLRRQIAVVDHQLVHESLEVRISPAGPLGNPSSSSPTASYGKAERPDQLPGRLGRLPTPRSKRAGPVDCIRSSGDVVQLESKPNPFAFGLATIRHLCNWSWSILALAITSRGGCGTT